MPSRLSSLRDGWVTDDSTPHIQRRVGEEAYLAEDAEGGDGAVAEGGKGGGSEGDGGEPSDSGGEADEEGDAVFAEDLADVGVFEAPVEVGVWEEEGKTGTDGGCHPHKEAQKRWPTEL